MRPRFLALLYDRVGSSIDKPRLEADLGLTLVDDRPGFLAFTAGDCRSYTLGDARILGTVYPRFGPAQPIVSSALGEAEESGAEVRLLSRYWGGYVGFFPAGHGFRILRDPSGSLPCYYAETSLGFVVASDVALMLAAGVVSPEINWSALARFYYLHGLPMPETCLQDIEELLPGYTLVIAAGVVDQRMRWSPWDHIADGDEMAGLARDALLHRTAQHSVEALTADYDRLLVSVSGGLDSSIVAACLAKAGRNVRCVTMFSADPSGDERVYARSLCQHLGLPLVERPYRVEDIDIDTAISPHLPRPIGQTLTHSYDKTHLALAEEFNADAFVTGNGGDNVFGFSQSGAVIVDRYMRQGLTPALLGTVSDVCRQTGSGPIAVIRSALRARRRGYRWTPGPMFLDLDRVGALVSEQPHQPWLVAPPESGPAKAAHVAALLRVQPLLEPARSKFAPVITPLISQPMIEACLAIPSWQWRDGGRDRAVARDAFSADLPTDVVRRRAKGGPDGFAAVVMNRHRSAIRERLLDGELARNRVVDRKALETRFGSEQPFSAEEVARLLDFADTEAWIAAWQHRRRAALSATASGRSSGPPSV